MAAVLPDWSEINRVGDEVSRSDGLVTDTAFILSDTLRHFSKVVEFSMTFAIFAGGSVT